jgi:hypothetical protein
LPAVFYTSITHLSLPPFFTHALLQYPPHTRLCSNSWTTLYFSHPHTQTAELHCSIVGVWHRHHHNIMPKGPDATNPSLNSKLFHEQTCSYNCSNSNHSKD